MTGSIFSRCKRSMGLALICVSILALPADAVGNSARAEAYGQGATLGGEAAASHGDGNRQVFKVGMYYVSPPLVGGAKVRTPDVPDAALAQMLAQSLGLSVQAVPAQQPEDVMTHVLHGRLRVGLTRILTAHTRPQDGIELVPTGYHSRPMAIMRTDTNIKSWTQLKGRTVCVAQDGLYAGTLAARYGAREKIVRAPADSLLALRTGGCDAAVHDEALLKPMIRLPEWRKFSATLPPGPRTSLVFVVKSQDVEMLATTRALVRQWRSERHLASLNERRVRDVAFEVYLDQAVPDCH